MEEIQFSDYKKHNDKYKKYLKLSEEFLSKTAIGLFETCVNFAVNGKWKDWDDKQKAASRFEFSDKMLWQTGDKNVDVLMNLREGVLSALEEISKRNQIPKP